MNHTEELICLAQSGNQDAKEMLLRENAGLIWSVTRRYIGRGTETDDLYQLGCLGFLKAVEGYDGSYGTQFSTYAVPKISGEIRRYLRDDGSIKVSRILKERAFTVSTVRNRLLLSLGREPTLTELSQHTGLTTEEIAEAESANVATESIQQTIGEDGFSLEKVLADSKTEDVLLEQISLRDAICKLAEREALVIKLRYFHGLTQTKIATLLNVSQVQVSRIEKKALQSLKESVKCND